MADTTTKPVVAADAAPATQTPPKPPVVAVVQRLIEAAEQKGFAFPEDYSVANALASAKLALQEVVNLNKQHIVDANGRPTGVVTEASMVNAVFDMAVQGMNVAKKQGYFIVYGNQLTFQRSYHGDKALAKRVQPGIEIYEAIVYEGDDFEYEVIRGRTVVTKHKTKLENQDPTKIRAAYCGVAETATGEDLGAVVFTIDRIKKSWGQSKTYKANGDGVHNKFPDEMALRTVVRRRTKPIINASTDQVLQQALRRQDEDAIDAEIGDEVARNANGETLALSATNDQVAVPAVGVAEVVIDGAQPAPDGEAGF